MGQPYCTVLISLPIVRLSTLLNFRNHSRTGSLPDSVRKKTTSSVISVRTRKSVPFLVLIATMGCHSKIQGLNRRSHRGSPKGFSCSNPSLRRSTWQTGSLEIMTNHTTISLCYKKQKAHTEVQAFKLDGAPGEIRTPDRLVRSVPPETAHPIVFKYLYGTCTVQ